MWADLSRRGYTNHADVLHARRVRGPPAAAPLLTCLESCALLPGGEGQPRASPALQLRQRARPLLAASLVHPHLSVQSPMTHPTACVGGAQLRQKHPEDVTTEDKKRTFCLALVKEMLLVRVRYIFFSP